MHLHTSDSDETSGAKVQNINKKTHKHRKNFDFKAKVRTFAAKFDGQSVARRAKVATATAAHRAWPLAAAWFHCDY